MESLKCISVGLWNDDSVVKILAAFAEGHSLVDSSHPPRDAMSSSSLSKHMDTHAHFYSEYKHTLNTT